jgi:hypothetical protein
MTVEKRSESWHERLLYRMASTQESIISYLVWVVLEGIFLWILLTIVSAAIADILHFNVSGNTIAADMMAFSFIVVLIQSLALYSYRLSPKYIFQNVNRMSGGPETARARRKGVVETPHDLAEYYWNHFEATRRRAEWLAGGHLDDLFELEWKRTRGENYEKLDLNRAADVIELDILNRSKDFGEKDDKAWEPYFTFANEWIAKFGDSEVIIGDWIRYLIKKYLATDKDIRAQAGFYFDRSFFERLKEDIEEHTQFYSLIGRIVAIAIILIIIIVFGRDVSSLL